MSRLATIANTARSNTSAPRSAPTLANHTSSPSRRHIVCDGGDRPDRRCRLGGELVDRQPTVVRRVLEGGDDPIQLAAGAQRAGFAETEQDAMTGAVAVADGLHQRQVLVPLVAPLHPCRLHEHTNDHGTSTRSSGGCVAPTLGRRTSPIRHKPPGHRPPHPATPLTPSNSSQNESVIGTSRKPRNVPLGPYMSTPVAYSNRDPAVHPEPARRRLQRCVVGEITLTHRHRRRHRHPAEAREISPDLIQLPLDLWGPRPSRFELLEDPRRRRLGHVNGDRVWSRQQGHRVDRPGRRVGFVPIPVIDVARLRLAAPARATARSCGTSSHPGCGSRARPRHCCSRPPESRRRRQRPLGHLLRRPVLRVAAEP